MKILKELRTKRGITQQELSNYLKVRRNAISRYESGDREPDYATLVKIAQFFNVSVDYLLNQYDKKTPANAEDNMNMDYKEFYEMMSQLTPEGKKKAKEYLDMLKTLENLENVEAKNKKAQ